MGIGLDVEDYQHLYEGNTYLEIILEEALIEFYDESRKMELQNLKSLSLHDQPCQQCAPLVQVTSSVSAK